MNVPAPKPSDLKIAPRPTQKVEETEKKPFVRRPHLTDRPFSNLKASLESK